VPSTRRRKRRPDGSVGGHFLESAAARTLDMKKLRKMSEREAIELFVASRWKENGGSPTCPHKGCGADRIYRMTVNRKLKDGFKEVLIFKCAACRRQFSPTSGTPLGHHKMEVRDYLYAIAHFVNGVKGRAALEAARTMDAQAKSMFVQHHKLREALTTLVRTHLLTGEVEIDGAGFGGKRRKANEVKRRRHSKTVPKDRNTVIVMRERGGETRAFVVPREVDAYATLFANISRTAVVFADEGSGWTDLDASHTVRRINHSKVGFVTEHANTNQAESFFSRMRRAAIGIHHRLAGDHLTTYAVEMAWRETHSREPNGTQFTLLLDALSHCGQSPNWTNYWDYPGRTA